MDEIQFNAPDLVLLDLGLPDIDGVDVLRKIRTSKYHQNLPVVILTARVEDFDRILGLEMGADDYIIKPFNIREVVARIRAVLRRCENSSSKELIKIGEIELDFEQRSVYKSGKICELTPTEFAILKLLMVQAGRIFTRDEILENAWEDTFETSSRILDTHIRNLRKKIENHPQEPVYIQTVHRIGYKFTPKGELK